MTELAIRPLERGDLDAVIRLHLGALPKDFITSLGRDFLEHVFYGSILELPHGVGRVVLGPSGLAGFVVGAYPAATWYGELPKRHAKAFVKGALASLADGPPALLGLAEVAVALLRGSEPDVYPADLGYIAVDPALRGHGLGKRLVHAHLEALRERGASGCWTKTHETNTAARRLYEACGFRYLARKRIRGVTSAYYGVPLERESRAAHTP